MNALETLPLAEAWARLEDEQPHLRIRDAARVLEVSEAELLASQMTTSAPKMQVQRLEGNFGELIKQLKEVGSVMALTRNEAMVHEKHGVYENVTLHGRGLGQMGLALGVIDLRLFLNHFVFGFAVTQPTPKGSRQSLQFFTQDGSAIHKIYATQETQMEAWQHLVEGYLATDQNPALDLSALPEKSHMEVPEQLNLDALKADWSALKDVHHFQALLKKHQIGRIPAYERIGPKYAQPLSPSAFERALILAEQARLPIMVFVGNTGCIQIHTGPVHNLKRMKQWFNVLDEGFNLHADTEQIAQAWLVRKPTSDGIVTSLEIFDANGQQIAILFGERKNGQEELPGWRILAQQLLEERGLNAVDSAKNSEGGAAA